MKKTFLLGIALCLAVVAFAQRGMEWYSYWGSNVSGNQIEPQRMVVDENGDIYVAALFGGDKVAVESKTLESNSPTDKGDAVIVKMSAVKNVLWTYPVANTGVATISDIAVNSKGEIIALGAFTQSVKVGENVMQLDDSNMGEAAIYVVKLTAAGEALAAWQISALGAKAGKLVIDSKDNIIITGLLDGDATFVSGGEAEGDFQNSAQLFVAKYDAEGALLWHQFRNDEGNSVYGTPSIAVDAEDNFYVAASVLGQTTLAGTPVNATASNAFLLAYSAEGEEKWAHVVEGEESDVAADVVVSPFGQVVIAVNHHSSDLRLDDLSDVFNNGYAFGAAFEHSAFFSFDLAGEFKWFYDWGYSNGDSGSDAVCHALRCTEEGVLYAAGMMTGRYGGSRLDEDVRTLPAGKNSGVETVDNQWLQHNTNGGNDCYLITLTRDGKLINAIRPGGPQYEIGTDVALSPDSKSIYFLSQINVRNNVPYTCPDNIFDSWTDLYAPDKWPSRKSQYTLLNVFCPENDGTSAEYTDAYKAKFASSMLIKYSLPEIDPEELPSFVVGEPYSQELSILNPKGEATLYLLEKYADVQFDGTTVSGTFENDKDRYIGIIAIDSIALPGEITYYAYDTETKASIRSNPRAARYLALTANNQEGMEAVTDDKKAAGRKVMRDGILFIERNGILYTAQGAVVK